MLEFAAKDYVEIAHTLGLLLGANQKQTDEEEKTGKALSDLLVNCFRLGLMVTRDQVGEMLQEAIKASPNDFKVKTVGGSLRVEQARLDLHRFCHHIETIYSVFRSE